MTSRDEYDVVANHVHPRYLDQEASLVVGAAVIVGAGIRVLVMAQGDVSMASHLLARFTAGTLLSLGLLPALMLVPAFVPAILMLRARELDGASQGSVARRYRWAALGVFTLGLFFAPLGALLAGALLALVATLVSTQPPLLPRRRSLVIGLSLAMALVALLIFDTGVGTLERVSDENSTHIGWVVHADEMWIEVIDVQPRRMTVLRVTPSTTRSTCTLRGPALHQRTLSQVLAGESRGPYESCSTS